MASRKLIVEVVGDSRSLERTFARSSRASKKFGNETTTSLGKVDSAFTKTQRIAAGGFIGGVALQQIVSFTKLAAESQQVIGQTGVALEAAGLSWEAYGTQIEKAIQAQSQLGFDDEALLRTFSKFIATTGDVNESIRLNALSMDVARQRHDDLETSAQLVTKAAIGQAGALRRLGLDVDTNASKTELLTFLTNKYGGAAQAAAGDAATAFDRMTVQIENAKEALGTLALPVMTNLAKVVDVATRSVIRLSDALGGMEKDADKLTFGDLFSSLLDLPDVFEKSLVPPWKWDEVASSQRKAADKAFAAAFANFGKDGEFDLGAIRRSMDDTFEADGTFNIPALRASLGPTKTSADATAQTREILAQANGDLAGVLREQVERRDRLGRMLEAARENRWTQAKIDDLSVRYANAQSAAIGTTKTIAANDRAAAEAAKESAKAAKETARATAEAARERAKSLEQIRQFRALGLDPTGNKPPPTIANLLKQITQLGKQDDISKNERGVLARIRKVLIDPINKAKPETRAAAKGLIDGIRDELDVDKKLVGPLTKTTSLRANNLLQGLVGLTPEVERELRARLSSFNSARVAVAGTTRPTGTFRGGEPITVHTTVNLDGQVVGKSVTRAQQKNRKRNPVQKRGSRRGGV